MVKGTTRHVILVKSPDPRVFEEAIFIVREDAKSTSLTPDGIIREAQDIASDYIRTHLRHSARRPLPSGAYVLLGAAVTGGIWAASIIF